MKNKRTIIKHCITISSLNWVDLPGKMEHPVGTSVLLLKHGPGIVSVKKVGHYLTLGVFEELLHGLQCHTAAQEKTSLKYAQGKANSSR